MRFLALMTLALTFASSALGQSQLAATYGKALLQCYGAENDKLACLGRTAETCMAREEDGETTLGMVSCLSAETEVWDNQMNVEYEATRVFFASMDGADSGQRVDALLTAQSAWNTFRDAECAMEYSTMGEGSIRSIVGADCFMSLTAERTVRLLELRELME